MRTGSGCRRDEKGAVALLVAILALVLLGCAALTVDITTLVMERQKLHDTVDAAAHAGAGALPTGDGTLTARQVALEVAQRNDPEITAPDIRFWCLVGSVADATSGTRQPDVSQIASGSCNPGPDAPVAKPKGGYLSSFGGGVRCDTVLCKIPCEPDDGDLCNTLEVVDEKPVQFGFGAAIGTPAGSTGSINAAACKGPCGSVAPNPIDLAVVGDRTGSMSGAEADLEVAIESLLEYLTPSQHHVALGTIGRSAPAGSGSGNTAPATCRSKPSSDRAVGPWFPVGFANDYDTTDVDPPSNPASLSSTSTLARAADCVGNSNSSTGTYLAAPMRAARELLTGSCPATLCASPSTPRPSPVRKAVMFMTDGEPNESTNPGNGYPYSSNGTTACNNAVSEATSAKAAGIMVVTIAFRLENVRCNGSSSALVTSKLAEMASPEPDGTASTDDGGGVGGGCNTSAEVTGENADGDNFFCTPTAAQLEPIFRTAAGQLTGGTRLINLPAD